MNLVRAFRAAGAAFALVLIGAVAHAVLPTPGVQGPFLGDQFTNIFSLQQAATFMNQMGFTTSITAGPANTQSTCTNLTTPLNQISTSAANGSLCLPTAIAGRMVVVSNIGTGQTVNIFSNNTPFTAGTPDNINGSAGTTAVTLANNSQSIFFSPANGQWSKQ